MVKRFELSVSAVGCLVAKHCAASVCRLKSSLNRRLSSALFWIFGTPSATASGNLESLATAFLSRLMTAVLNCLQKERKESSLREKFLPASGTAVPESNRITPKVTLCIFSPRTLLGPSRLLRLKTTARRLVFGAQELKHP